MALSLWSWLVVALIAAGIYVGWSRRFLAFGSLAIVNVVAHLIQFTAPDVPSSAGTVVRPVSVVTDQLALRPTLVAQGDPLGFLQMATHMFLHADFSHLFGNMIILFVIGFYLEERVGHRWLVATYLVTGFVAAGAEVVNLWGADTYMLGASGADFGLIGALAAAYPRDRLRIPVIAFFIFFIEMPAWMAAVVFAVLQGVFMTVFAPFDNVAYTAHLGGLAAGIVWGWTALRPRDRTVAPERTEALTPFATTRAAQEALAHMETGRDEPEVHRAWIDRFVAAARCPQCGVPVERHGGGVRCPHGHTVPPRS